MPERVEILTRVPLPGTAKTRLIPVLGADGAAALHAALVAETLARVRQSGLPARIHLDGPLDHPWCEALRAQGWALLAQIPGDLGARLQAAMAGPGRRLALGTDCVTFAPAWLVEAARAPAPVVLGPAEDGGYWTLCVDAPLPEIFEQIDWSTPRVAAQTRARAQALGLPVGEAPSCYDIDTPEDLDRLRSDPACPPSLRPFLR